MADSDKDELQEALERFRLVDSTESQQRQRELEDLRVAAGDQWPEDVKRARMGQGTGGTLPPVPARPCETFNKLLQPLDQVENQFKQARLALKFAPKGDGASRETAEIFGDIARAIQTDSRAELARAWAFGRTLRAGRGAYRVLVEYCDDDSDNLEIVYKRILNQAAVYFDPYAQEPDWSDARFCFITEDMPFEAFKREWPKSDLAACDDDTLSSIGNQFPGWVVTDGTEKNRTVRVAEYFYLEYEKSERPLKSGATKDDGTLVMRELKKPVIKWCKLTALDILERATWAGKHIPIIPMIAREENINGDRRWTGMVRPAIGAQRSYNYHRNAQIETVGLATRAPYQLDPEQVEGYEDWWKASNTRNFPYLPRKSFDARGNQYLPIQRNVEEPAIQAITLAAHEADGDLKATTGIFDPSLGNLNPADRSGKAVLALQKQAELGSSGYLYNVAHMSMVLEGKILLDLIPKVYNTPGRIVAALGEDDQRKNVMLGQPFIDQNGTPQPVPPGTPGAKVIDLAQGEYQVAIEVGKSFTTRREEGASAMSEMAQAAPQLLPMYADLWVGNLDFPGSKQIADRLKKALPPQLQEQTNSPELRAMQLQQQNQQAGQMIEFLTKELQGKTEFIHTEQIKAQQKLQEIQLEQQGKERLAWIQVSAQLAIAGAKLDADMAGKFVDALETRAATILDAHLQKLTQAHEIASKAVDHAHEQLMTGAQMAHEQAQQAGDRFHEGAMQLQQQQHEAEQSDADRQLAAAQAEQKGVE